MTPPILSCTPLTVAALVGLALVWINRYNDSVDVAIATVAALRYMGSLRMPPMVASDTFGEHSTMNNLARSLEELFPEGTPVRVVQTTRRRGASYQAESVGVVQAWENLPTGSWFVHGKNDKLWLTRLKLQKADGEITLLVIDDATSIAKLEAASR